MTVQQLIAELQKHPQDLVVIAFDGYDGDAEPITELSLIEVWMDDEDGKRILGKQLLVEP